MVSTPCTGLGPPGSSAAPQMLYGGWAWWWHLLRTLKKAPHLLRAVAGGCLVLSETLLEGLEWLCTGLADPTDDGMGGRASSNAHLEVVTVPLPGLGLGRHTLAILVQLPATVASSDLQGCLHVEAVTEESVREVCPPFPVLDCHGASQVSPPISFLPVGRTADRRPNHHGGVLTVLLPRSAMATPCCTSGPLLQRLLPASHFQQ